MENDNMIPLESTNDYNNNQISKNILFIPENKYRDKEEVESILNKKNDTIQFDLTNIEVQNQKDNQVENKDKTDNNTIDRNNNNQNIKNKKTIKKEYYKMKPNIIRQNNLRFVEPYEFEYQIYAKGRWIGRKLIDVLVHEFRQYNEEYFLNAIKTGSLKINRYLTNPIKILQRNDFITHKVIRKENPIIDAELEVVFENDEFLVVNKPSSWPVHVCGGYQFNTLHRILMDEYNYENIKVLHRLDKPTSGIVILAKNKDAAEYFRKHMHTERIRKTYLCRVKGNFPYEKINVVRAIVLINQAKGIYSDSDASIKPGDPCNFGEYYATDVDADVDNKNKKKHNSKKNKTFDKSGVNIKLEENPDKEYESADEEKNEPKYAETDFEKFFYDEKSNTSVVFALPKTGRTHQIRIHLRHLGYPIANDPCYGGIVYNGLKDFDNPDFLKFHQIIPHSNLNKTSNIEELNNIENGLENDNQDAKPKIEYTKVLSASEVNCYKIWLHAFKYLFEDYEFTTKLPDWATKEYDLDYKF